MNLTLNRTRRGQDGIFGQLLDESGKLIACTLEHSYGQAVMTDEEGTVDTVWGPKLYNGKFKCVRGIHQLDHMVHNFETFEITDVEGHTNILFHIGNYNRDSEGCVLLGEYIQTSTAYPGGQMLTCSREAFSKFMELQEGVNEFILTVTG